MKKYIKIVSLLAFSSLAIVSCKGYLDQMPSTALPTDEAIKSYSDAQTAVTGIYDGLQNTSYYGAVMDYYGDVKGDYLQTEDPADRTSSLYEMNYIAQSSPSIWLIPYNTIRRANNLMTALDAGKVTDAEPEEIGALYAEALVLRALGHFDLVRVYGKPYTMDNGAGYGIPIELVAHDPQSKPTRNSVAEVYKVVIDDLNAAITKFKAAGATAPTVKNGFFNVWGAKSLLARVYLYKGENQLAFTTAADVIENGPYELVTNADYAASWGFGAANTEIIFQVLNNSSDSGDRESMGYLLAENGYGAMVISKKLFQIMEARPDDVRNQLRLVSKVAANITKFGADRVWLNKYQGLAGDSRICNIPVLRLSEQYLIAAEAGMKAGGAATTAAKKYLNDIATRANPDAEELELTIDNILLEKGIEMVGEGQRFFDLMRNNKNSDRTIRWSYIFPELKSVNFDNEYFRIILPIPLAEMDANPNMRPQQNPGYGSY